MDAHDINTLAAERVESMRRCGLTDAEIISELATSNVCMSEANEELRAELSLARRQIVTLEWKVETLRDCERGI